MTPTLACPYPRLRWFDKVVTALTWACAIAVFATVGWMAISPDDPRGAVSLSIGDVAVVIPQVAALAAVVAGVVTAIIGRMLPDAGTFAVAVGLAGANLQGHPSSYLLMNATGVGARRILCLSLVAEAVVWFLVIAVAFVVSGLVMRWCWCYGRGESDADAGPAKLATLSIADVPVLGRLVCGARLTADATRPRKGVLHGVVTALAALLLIRLLATGSPARTVQHGQVYFSLAAAFFIGGYAAHRMFPVRTALWGCLAVPVVCIIGYAWTMLRAQGPASYARIASVPPTAFIRALPLEYISVGIAGVLASFWGRASPGQPADERDRPVEGSRA
ncbi:MAG: hypothetical protein JSV19_07760 [Phycisphaerales bacterium]|nr:MAG: hypothetical protein JSV19_07760 [Phycisphaerales bacterium]